MDPLVILEIAPKTADAQSNSLHSLSLFTSQTELETLRVDNPICITRSSSWPSRPDVHSHVHSYSYRAYRKYAELTCIVYTFRATADWARPPCCQLISSVLSVSPQRQPQRIARPTSDGILVSFVLRLRVAAASRPRRACRSLHGNMYMTCTCHIHGHVHTCPCTRVILVLVSFLRPRTAICSQTTRDARRLLLNQARLLNQASS